jgi:hypothetical protein
LKSFRFFFRTLHLHESQQSGRKRSRGLKVTRGFILVKQNRYDRHIRDQVLAELSRSRGVLF